MAANFPSESAWKAVVQKHRLKDNGLQKALAIYEKLDEEKHDERLKALDAARKLAGNLGKGKEVAANAEASKFLDQLASAAESTKKLVAGSAAKAEEQSASKRPDFSKVKALSGGIRKLADLSKADKGGAEAAKSGGGTGDAIPCLDEAGEVAVAAAKVIAATAAVDAAAGATGLTGGAATVALVASVVILARLSVDYIESLKRFFICLKRHDNPAQRLYGARLQQAIDLRAQLVREKERLSK